MSTINKQIMKKYLFGVAVATMAIAVSTFTTKATNQKRDHEIVVPVNATEWMLVDPLEQGDTWDCFDGGLKCKGALKPNAVPNTNGFYNDSQVDSYISNTHYEEIY